ncbi:MAG: DUF1489 domain-containing protein [Rhodobacteraceae bacterium]|nr:DUF1489 domain-containing protein [Paracoccaceae bacterium]
MAGFVNLLKLCVGAESVEDLAGWQAQRFGAGTPCHVTRMWPRREAEVLAGGSLYWVVKGLVLCRQRIVGLEERLGADGITRCAIMLDAQIVRTEPMPKRPFQGWRYLAPEAAPPDLKPGREAEGHLPRDLAAALAEIGLR